MKKFFNLVVVLAALLSVASCSDVPNPYDLLVSDPNAGKSLPYKNASLSSGFTVQTITGNAWSQGSTYTQASGYSNSTYTASESWLVSPGIKTEKDSVVLSFDYTIRYGSSLSDADVQNYHQVLISTDYEDDVTTATWTKLPFTASKSSYSDWTLYGSGDIQIPDSFLNKDKVYIAFVYKCGSTQGTTSTWELENFYMRKGVSSDTPDTPTTSGDLPYTSSNLYSGWTTYSPIEADPWSQGSTYTQATGYQKWDGTNKSNKEVKGYLISPTLNTAATSGNVKFSFDNTIRYTTNVTGWADYHKIYVSSDYDGMNFNNATWKEISWTPTASSYSDWTLYTSGEIQLPAEYVNKTNVHIAFYFYAPASGSTTWELENFNIQEGVASGTTPVTPTTGTFNQDFTSSQGSWNIQNVSLGDLSYVWTQTSSYGMKASAYMSSSNHAAEAWLISPTFTVSDATMTFVNALNFLNSGTLTDHIGVYVSTNYTSGAPSTASWTRLTISNPPTGSSYDWVTSTVDLSAYKGKQVTVAFKYVSTTSVAPTWEIKSVTCGSGSTTTPTTPTTGAGSESDPYSCSAAIAAGNPGTYGWVKGYIVGYVDGMAYSGATFAIPSAAETEIIIADSPTETDASKCMPVQLPSGAIRTGLELFANQANYKQQVVLYGQLTKYFGVPGIKSTSCAIINGTTIGTKP